MNNKQKIVLWVAILIVVGITMFPPWRVEKGKIWLPYSNKNTASMVVSGKYSFIFHPPSSAVGIDISRLVVQIAIVTILAAGGLVTTKK